MSSFHSVYRLQIHRLFPFAQAKEALPYLCALGIDGVYISPIFTARRGSSHGYDVADPRFINPEIGGERGFIDFVRVAHRHGLAVICDHVANHMAASIENPWWRDVLENGPNARYAHFFDIDWKSPHRELHNKVLVPFLSMPLKEALQNKAIRLVVRAEGICFEVAFHTLPCNPELYHGFVQKLGLHSEIERLFSRIKPAQTPEEKQQRARIIAECKYCIDKELTAYKKDFEQLFAEINADPVKMEALLRKQYFRLDYWQTGYQYINYRRFFDINDLVGLRAEDDDVFAAYHEKLFSLMQRGYVDGLRVDHPDGLKDPKKYFHKLRSAGAPYIIAEKILEKDESLREEWAIDGSVGYEYLNKLSGLFVYPGGKKPLTDIYHAFIGEKEDPDALLYRCKREYAAKYMVSEIAALSKQYAREGVSKEELTLALIELCACFPVYRTYVDREPIAPVDMRYITEAFALFEQRDIDVSPEVQRFLRRIFLRGEEPRELLLRFQQLAPPIMAKGLEDTFLYNYYRLISLNEVGHNPKYFGSTPEAFHAHNQTMLERFPYGLTTANTHDTKRSEDVRLRIHVLSELFEEWGELSEIVRKQTAEWKTDIGQCSAPDPRDEYFIYQTLVGICPSTPFDQELQERIISYVLKALRESKRYTNWIVHNDNYERATKHFLKQLFHDFAHPFWQALFPFIEKVIRLADRTRLSACIVRLGSPGVFDLYQGTEFPFLALVDPDNRRPVDFPAHRRIFSEIAHRTTVPHDTDREKLYILYKLLNYRKNNRALFLNGDYTPIDAEMAVVFFREYHGRCVLVIGRRFFARFPETDEHISLPSALQNTRWKNCITKEEVPIGSSPSLRELLQGMPAVIMEKL